jgi:hypothetical protein
MAQQNQNNENKADPVDADDVHQAQDTGTTGGEKTAGIGKQAHVPKGHPDDPTRDTWERISGKKVQTTKEEMPSPERPEKPKLD